MKRFLVFAVLIVASGIVFAKSLLSSNPPKAQALAVGVTVVYTQLPTDTPYPTMTPFPTIDYRATDQAYQLAMEAQRNDMIKAQLAHDEEMLRQQVELARINATATAAGTQVAMVNAQNTLTSGQLTLGAGMLTGTAEAPMKAAALLQVQIDAKNSKRDDVIYVIGTGALVLFLLSGSYFFVKKAKGIKAAEIMKDLQTEEYNPDDYIPQPAQTGVLEISDEPEPGRINRRMEQRFAQVLLAMHELEPDDKAVNLLESFWIVRGARDKFQNRNEFLAVRDDWMSDEEGIIKRLDPTLANSTFYVAKWDEVQLIANGERL